MQQQWHALLALIEQCGVMSAPLCRTLLAHPEPLAVCELDAFRPSAAAWQRAYRQLAAIESLGISPVPVWQLPPLLLRCRPLPVALFVRGDPSLLNAAAVSIVGARAASVAPLQWAERKARDAASAGFLVVSGGARGIDSAAHRGALAADGKTVAYLGVPADVTYPAANRRLFSRILEHGGALVSEHPPGSHTFASSHAMRNRFIAAHATRLFVAEAGERSGSLGTAAFAVSLGVPIWVPPADVGGERTGLLALLAAGHGRILFER